MTGLPGVALLATLLAAFGATSCNLFRKPTPATPPAPAPVAKSKPALKLPETPKPNPPRIPPPEVSPSEGRDLKDIKPVEIPAPEMTPPKPPRRAPRRKPATVPVPSAETPAPAPPAPQLRPILTTEQQQQLNDSVYKRLERAQQALGSLQGRTLNKRQLAAAQQIRTFMRQAQESRNSDLIRANNLAERADVLAADLLKTIQ